MTSENANSTFRRIFRRIFRRHRKCSEAPVALLGIVAHGFCGVTISSSQHHLIITAAKVAKATSDFEAAVPSDRVLVVARDRVDRFVERATHVEDAELAQRRCKELAGVSRNLLDHGELVAALERLPERHLAKLLRCLTVIRISAQFHLVARFRFVEQPVALDDERRKDLVLDKGKTLDILVVSRQQRTAHDQLLLEARAAEREHVDLAAVGAAVLVENDAVRWDGDKDRAAHWGVQEEGLLELVIGVTANVPSKLDRVATFLVLGVRQPDRHLLGDRVDLCSSEVIDEHLLGLVRWLAWREHEFAHEEGELSVGHTQGHGGLGDWEIAVHGGVVMSARRRGVGRLGLQATVSLFLLPASRSQRVFQNATPLKPQRSALGAN